MGLGDGVGDVDVYGDYDDNGVEGDVVAAAATDFYGVDVGDDL